MVNERGGDSRPGSAKEMAEKIKQKLNFKHKINLYREIHNAVDDASEEVKMVFKNCEAKAREITIEKRIYSKNLFDTPRLLRLENYEFDFDKNLSWENIWRLKDRSNLTYYYKTDTLIEIYISKF